MTPNFAINTSALASLCRKWKVRKLALFGSAVRLGGRASARPWRRFKH